MAKLWELIKKENNIHQEDIKEINDTETVKIIKDLKTHGFQQASLCGAAVVVLKTNISKLYYNKIINDENFFKEEENRKNNLQKQLNEEESNLSKLEEEIQGHISRKNELENEISELRKTKDKINAGDKATLGEIQPPDKLGYIIGVIILIFLTAYLLLFYTSAIYNAFVYDVKEATAESILHNAKLTTTIFNPNAIIDAYNKSIFTFLFILISPIIFLGLGYLIYKFNEKNSYLKTAMILLFTFFFDAIIAYEIVAAIYEGKYITGQGGANTEWNFNMIYSSVPFYIILAAGFVIYIIWGLVLSFVIQGHNNLNPIRAALRTVNGQIKLIQDKIIELNKSINNSNTAKIAIETLIKKHKIDLSLRTFNRQNFEHRVEEFISGWHNWITQGYPYEKHIRLQEADKAKDEIIDLLYKKNIQNYDNE